MSLATDAGNSTTTETRATQSQAILQMDINKEPSNLRNLSQVQFISFHWAKVALCSQGLKLGAGSPADQYHLGASSLAHQGLTLICLLASSDMLFQVT